MRGISTQDADQILRDYGRLAYGVARAYQNKGLPWEDLRQEAMLGLIYASQHFDPERGAQFSTYAVYWIRKQILQALDREKATSLQAESLEDGHLVELVAPEPRAQDNPNLDLPDELPAMERQILILSCQNQLSLQEISRYLRIPVERVKQLRSKALRRLKSAL